MNHDLSDRQKQYEAAYDHSIIGRIPVIIRVDGRGFSKLTRDVPKPYCRKMAKAMAYTMFETIKQIDGAAFGYTQSDEITFIIHRPYTKKNDADSWFNNRIQKIGTVTSSMVTYYFNEFRKTEDAPNISGPSFFDARVFGLPDSTETINNLIFRQQDCRVNAVSSAAMAELGRKYGRKEAFTKLQGRSTSDRITMLKEECDISFEESYTSQFKMGAAAYRAPRIMDTSAGQMTRVKWYLDHAPPSFINDRIWLINLLSNGRDIFKPEREFNGTEG